MYSFGPFTLSVECFELAKNGRTVPLPKLPMEVLILLLERNGGLVSRQELAESLWSTSDSEAVKQGINNAVNRIRYTLVDNAEEPLYIQTVIGKGYRFVSPVKIVQADSEKSPQAGSGSPFRSTRIEPAAVDEPSPSGGQISALSAIQPTQTVSVADEEKSGFVPGAHAPARTPGGSLLPPVWPRRWALPGAVTALLCLTAVFFVASHKKRPAVIPQQTRTFDLTRLTSNPTKEWVTASAISPDGKTVVFAEPDQLRFFSQNGADIRRTATPDLRIIDRIAWFTDNYQLLVSGLNRSSGLLEVWLYAAAASAPLKMRTDARNAVPSPSPSGSQIAFTNASGSEIWVMDMLGQRPRRLRESSAGTTYEALTWTSSGNTVLAERVHRDAHLPAPSWEPTQGLENSYIALDASTGKINAIVNGIWMEDAALLPTGELIYTQPDEQGLGLWSVRIDPDTGGFRGSPHLLQEVPQLRALTAANNGTMAAISIHIRPQIAVGDLRRHPVALENVHPLATEGTQAYPHAWSADSTSLYFEEKRNDQRWRIVSMALGASQSVNLVSSPLDQTNPRLTPDRQWVLFAGREPGMRPSQLFRIPPSGGAPQLVPIDGPVTDFRCPSHAGTCLLRELDDLKRLVFVPIDPVRGTGSPVLTLPWKASNNLGDWNVSSDGKRVAITPSDNDEHQLQVIDIATGHVQQVSVDVHRPIESVSWAADGKGWFLALTNGHGSDLVYVEPSRPPALLRQTTGRTYAVPSPNGRKLAFVDQNIDSNVWLLHTAGNVAADGK